MTTHQVLELARKHESGGELREAEALYRRVLDEQPDHHAALGLLGMLLYRTGRAAEAIELLGRAVAALPAEGEYHHRLGIVLAAMGRSDEAIVAYRNAIALAPRSAEAHCNLGTTLGMNGLHEQAITSFNTALSINPGMAEAMVGLGFALNAANRRDEAIAAYRRALALRPSYAEAAYSLAGVLRASGRIREAADAYEAALAARPQWPELLGDIALSLRELRRFDKAIEAYRAVLALRPGDAEAWYGMAAAQIEVGDVEGAIESDARRQSSGSPLFKILLHPDYSPETILREHAEWALRDADPLTDAAPPHGNDPSPERRLRVGYVSADFRDHVVGLNLLPLMREHDKRHVEVFCYGDAERADEITRRFQGYAERWRDVKDWSDERLAQFVRDDRIDVLVDLALHTGRRLLVFARKPAPVQVTFAGYPGTTGLKAIDYRLTDPYLDPPGNDRWYVEQSLRLPHTFWCYEPPEATPDVGPLPALSNGFVTFGCLAHASRVNEPLVQRWAAVMRSVEHSRLILLAPEGGCRERVLQTLASERVEAERVQFVQAQPRHDYLRVYNRIDIGLDTFPYNGHTTSLDSMWMGAPVVTLVGPTAVSRAGFSHLSNLGLTELAAETPEQFVTIATTLAGDLPRLARLRSTLRERLLRSPLTDSKSFARGIEDAYRRMWRRWCQGRRAGG